MICCMTSSEEPAPLAGRGIIGEAAGRYRLTRGGGGGGRGKAATPATATGAGWGGGRAVAAPAAGQCGKHDQRPGGRFGDAAGLTGVIGWRVCAGDHRCAAAIEGLLRVGRDGAEGDEVGAKAIIEGITGGIKEVCRDGK